MTQINAQIHLIYFTNRGEILARKLQKGFLELCYPCDISSGKNGAYKVWTKTNFIKGNVLIFIGAAGIAVRAIAPYIRHKSEDPAVVVLDELGRHAVSLLSGHIGEANYFTSLAASLSGGESVITTATDVNGLFAADVFAKRNQLTVADYKKAKLFAAEILKERHGFITLSPMLEEMTQVRGTVPSCITIGEKTDEGPCACVTAETVPTECLRLVPRCLVVGMGCRRGKSKADLMEFLHRTLSEHDLDERAVASICSIDLKKDEEGLSELAREYGVPFRTYSAEELNQVKGEFTPSQFVRETTGTDNICERAAIAGGGERFLIRKTAADGMTVSVALRRVMLYFREDSGKTADRTCKDQTEGKNYTFISHRSCEYFPCHKGIKEEEFNCLFCYCPLYVLGPDCGGRFYYNRRGRKVCTDCSIPHIRSNYDYIASRYKEIADLMREREKKDKERE